MFKNKWISFFGVFALFIFIALGAIGGCHDNNADGDGGLNGDGDGLTMITIMNNLSDSVCVSISFGAGSCFTADDLEMLCVPAVCPVLTSGSCTFMLDASSSQDITTSDNQTNCDGGEGTVEARLTIALNVPQGAECPVTQVEFALYGNFGNSTILDTYDITLVNGFNLPVEIEASGGDNAGPVTSATGNQSNPGVFPAGCDLCTAVDMPPANCGFIPGDNTQCHGGTQFDPDPPCCLTQGSGGSFTVIINPTAAPTPTAAPVATCPPGTCSGCSSMNPFCCPATGGCADSVGGLSGCSDTICTIQ